MELRGGVGGGGHTTPLLWKFKLYRFRLVKLLNIGLEPILKK